MSANSPKIIVNVRLPNDLFWKLNEVSRLSGDTKSAIIRRSLAQEIKKLKKLFNGETR